MLIQAIKLTQNSLDEMLNNLFFITNKLDSVIKTAPKEKIKFFILVPVVYPTHSKSGEVNRPTTYFHDRSNGECVELRLLLKV